MKKVIAFVLVALFAVSGVFAQTSWKSARHSFNWGIGGNVAETDICPVEGHGIPWKTMNGSAQVGYEYRFAERFSFRANFLLSRLQGFDADSKLDFAEKRHLNFRTWTFDINAMFNFYYLKMKDITPESTFGQRWAGYITVGFGGAIYNPKSSFRSSNQNVWVSTRALKAEGRYYNTGAWTLPFGLGFKYQASKNFYIGCELLQHVLVGSKGKGNDYLDGMSSFGFGKDTPAGLSAQVQKAVRGNVHGGDKGDQYTTGLITFGYTFTPCAVKHVARPKYLN
ncbi:MAG: outer membrane beta-barrel protein [Bacteroidales bacterium]|nr:outer membrane beta-barrel protein [Bacteroidales bacterium]